MSAAPERPIRVAVNLCWLVPGRVGGSEEYLVRQLRGLAEAERATSTTHPRATTVYGPRALASEYGDLDVVTMPTGRDSRALRIALEHSWLAARTRRADLVHHGGGTMPLVGRSPTLLTVHDLQYLDFPGYFSAARRHYLAVAVPRSVAHATVVAVPSEFVAGTVIDRFGLDPDRVRVVPHGVPDVERPTPDVIADAERRHGVRPPYVVYPAITHPHKGHRSLVELVEHDPDHSVVLIGGAGAAEAEVDAAIAASRDPERIVRPGRVPADDRDALVAGADALVFPSEYEGFGAPLVEAMALGTPVVASDASAVVEVVADAAVIVEGRSGAAWADGVATAIARRDELVHRGRLRREAFTQARSGAALAEAYELAVDLGAAR